MSDQSKHGEAICFTSGPQGAAFAAGVIHAWLASDRAEPRVVAGISTGAITAAAMQRAMRERGESGHRTDATRWEWFQKYLGDILDRPLDVIWKAFPNPVDFLSPTSPVRDLSCPATLKDEETRARHQFWILTKLGIWIAGLGISIGELGTLAVLKVRRDERIPMPVFGSGWVANVWRNALYYLQCASIGLKLLLAVIFRPLFTRTWNRFIKDEHAGEGTTAGLRGPSTLLPIRPLFGWRVWLLACLTALGIAAIVAGVVYVTWLIDHWYGAMIATLTGVCLVALVVLVFILVLKPPSFQKKLRLAARDISKEDGTSSTTKEKTFFGRLTTSALNACGLNLGVISNYEMKRRIWNRFATPEDLTPVVRCDEESGTNLVVVASALQPLKDLNHQCSARSGTSLVDALAAANTVQPLFAPIHLSGDQVKQWLRDKELRHFRDKELDLVDGGVIRKNPVPALFNWLQGRPHVTEALESDSPGDPRIHVVYNVPIDPFDAYEGEAQPVRIDLIESAQVGILMRAQRDTRVEVEQTNFLSRIVNANELLGRVPSLSPGEKESPGTEKKLFRIFAGEIAPARELKFENALSPTREEGLIAAAEGCRRTLGRLYRIEIQKQLDVYGSTECATLLKQIAPDRANERFQCGLPEVCGHCSGKLTPYPFSPQTPKMIKKDFGCGPGDDLRKELPHLCDGRPRIAFVASGGVFRGAFHIGLLGAMQTLDITPDLVVGASVGTLMGSALAAMRFCDDSPQQRGLLAELTRTFMHVDETVALTVPLKTAVKQLGLRARRLKLSPAELRAAVRAGTASDVGYASTGVPPIVTDTLSQLFIIPPAETFKAGSDFLAGRFAKAASHLISLMRTNTLDNLGIRYAIIGTSLLEGAAKTLMGAHADVDLNQRQPYLRKEPKSGQKSTAVFCTTAYVNYRWPLLLGRDALFDAAPVFRFLYAALSSSAFPAAFPARQEAEVFPGKGLVTNLFCDGGTFDNLPFLPAIEILSETQRVGFPDSGKTPKKFLVDRLRAPDLIICGGFDPSPSQDGGQSFTTRSEVNARTAALGAAVKTDSFVAMSRVAAEQLRKLAEAACGKEELPQETKELMINSVIAGIVNVVPATDLHVNPTFGMSRSLGFSRERVAASIADGCFQTLRALQKQGQDKCSDVGKSLKVLQIKVDERIGGYKDCECPYFMVECAFEQAAREAKGDKAKDCDQIYQACCTDPVHRKRPRVPEVP